jgi:PDZ domain-containing protein
MSRVFTRGRAAVLASLLGATVLCAQAARDAANGIVIDGKFDTATEHVLIPVTVGGHVFWCNPDSGFSALMALDQAKAIAAGLSVSPGVPTPDGNSPTPGDRSTTTTVVVGGVSYGNQRIIVRRFAQEAPDMDCIMGVALLRQFVVEFDHMTPRLTLYERAGYRPPPGAEAIPLLFRTNPRVPYVDVQMTLRDGTELPLRVLPDTGTSFFGALLVGSAAARVQSQLPSARAILYPDPQIGRITQLMAARPRAVTVGAFAVNEPVIGLLQGNLGGDGSLADGTLGSGFLRRFTVAFDFDGHKMYLAPNERYRQRHVFDASGVGFIRRAATDVVFDVIPDSAGAEAGVRIGDVLVKIDNRAAGDLTPVQLRDLLSADSSTRRLVLERDGRSVTVVLRLRARI